MGQRSAVLAVLLLLGTFLRTGASAQEPEQGQAQERAEAERYFQRGNELYAKGEFDGAARMFRVCVALAPGLAGPYRRLGQAYRRLGRCPDAVDKFLTYLEMRPSGRYAPEIRREMAACAHDSGLPAADPDRPLTGRLSLDVDPEGARVLVAGRFVGLAPLEPLTLKPGDYPVQVTKEGLRTWAKTLQVAAGKTTEVLVELSPLPEAERPAVLGRLVLAVTPVGAAVTVDGRLVGESPLPDLELPGGTHEVRIARPGFLPETHPVEVPPRGEAKLEVALVRLPGLIEEPAAAAAVPTAAGEEAAPSGIGRTFGWLLTGTAVVAAAWKHIPWLNN